MITAEILGLINQDIRREIQALTSATRSGTRKATDGLKNDLRQQVANAGLGGKLARTWQSQFFERRGIEAAGNVYSKAPHIIESFDEGVIVRARNARLLAIPTENAPKRINNRKTTPRHYEKYIRPLKYIERPGKLPLLIDEYEAVSYKRKTKAGKKKGDFRKFNRDIDPGAQTGRTSVVVFVLVPIAKMPRVLDVEGAAKKWAELHIALIQQIYAGQPEK